MITVTVTEYGLKRTVLELANADPTDNLIATRTGKARMACLAGLVVFGLSESPMPITKNPASWIMSVPRSNGADSLAVYVDAAQPPRVAHFHNLLIFARKFLLESNVS